MICIKYVITVKSGCQVLECKNGGFCDGHIADNPVCYCPSGFSGNDCATVITSSSASGSQTKTFFGDLTIPSEITCVFGEECTIPFQIITADGIRPVVSLGFASPPLSIEKPQVYKKSGTSTIYQGFAQVHPTKIGTFEVCLQAVDANKTEAEMCVDVDVIGNSTRSVDKNQPSYVVPTTTDGSTVLCQINKACHLDMHFTKGDAFRFTGTCPSVRVMDTAPSESIHIFDAVEHFSDCSSDIYYHTNTTGSRSICVQVSLPGKRGETRCYTLKIVLDIEKEVESPCQGKVCGNGGSCLADLLTSPARAFCVCSTGYVGIDCSSEMTTPTTIVDSTTKQTSASVGQSSDASTTPASTYSTNNLSSFVISNTIHATEIPSSSAPIIQIQVSTTVAPEVPTTTQATTETVTTTATVVSTSTVKISAGPGSGSISSTSPPSTQLKRESSTESTTAAELNGSNESFIQVQEGNELVLNCRVDNVTQQVNFEWSKMKNCDGLTDNQQGAVYRKTHASLGDAGTYSCRMTDKKSPENYQIKTFHVEITQTHIVDTCSFDDGGLCSWHQLNNDNYDWTIYSGPTLSEGTGPENDHTVGTSQGKYAYLEASAPRLMGENASLSSSLLPANHTMCFEFWYHMLGNGCGNLFVRIRDSCGQRTEELFTIKDDQGDRWHKSSLTITAQQVPNDFTLVVTADIGSTYKGDIAIDDLSLREGACTGNFGDPALVG